MHRSVISDSDHFDVLKDIIYLPYRYEDTDSVNDILLRLAAIDIELLRGLRTAHVDIILTNRHITDIKEYIDLRGVTPRGWEDTGLTWEDIPGLGGNPVVIKIGESDPGDSHNSINLELHEVAHAINLFLLDQLSESTEFAVIHAAEKYSMFGEYPYYDYKEEYFAECFAYYYYSAESNAALLEKAPLTHALIAGLSIDYFEE